MDKTMTISRNTAIKYLLLHSVPSGNCQAAKFYHDDGVWVFKATEEVIKNWNRAS